MVLYGAQTEGEEGRLDAYPAVTQDTPADFTGTQLTWAAEQGHETVVGALLGNGAPASIWDHDGMASLMLAFESGQSGVCTMPVQPRSGEGLDAEDGDDSKALHVAASQGDASWVGNLLDQGVQANAKDREGRTPLLLACERGHMETIHLLVRHVEAARGLDERDGNGRTALHHAAMGGLEAVVNLMLSEGAQANIEDDIGMTPLMLACQLNRVGIARTLVRHMRGQGLEKRDGNGRTALHYATVGGLEEVANLMLSEGAQANIEDANGMTPLMLACRSGHLRIAQRLVRHMRGQGLQNRDLGGNTALHYAAVCGRELHWEAVCRSRGVRGLYELPLPTFGCTFGRSSYTKAVRVLLLAGADATLTNNEGQTPRQVAELEGIADTVAVFNRWPEDLKRLTLQRARWLHDATANHAHDRTAALLPAVLAARVEGGQELPRLQMATGQASEGEQAVRALAEFMLMRVPDGPFKDIMRMLEQRKPAGGVSEASEKQQPSLFAGFW